MEFARTVRSALSVPSESPPAYDLRPPEIGKRTSASPLYFREYVHVVPSVVRATDALHRSYFGERHGARQRAVAVAVSVVSRARRKRGRRGTSGVGVGTTDGASSVKSRTCPRSRGAARSGSVIRIWGTDRTRSGRRRTYARLRTSLRIAGLGKRSGDSTYAVCSLRARLRGSGFRGEACGICQDGIVVPKALYGTGLRTVEISRARCRSALRTSSAGYGTSAPGRIPPRAGFSGTRRPGRDRPTVRYAGNAVERIAVNAGR